MSCEEFISLIIIKVKSYDFKKMLDYYEMAAPLRRNTDAAEVGKSAKFLLSDLASGVTGEILHVDCGFNVMGAPPAVV